MKYNVMMASDVNYLPYVEITLKSLLMHNENLSVFILHTGDISESWQNDLQPYFAKRYSTLQLVHIDKSELDSFSANNYITSATYLRFYIDRLLHYSDIPYWIYLDCDIVINGNITHPFECLDFSRHSLAAVLDPYVTRVSHPYQNGDYFNAGVLYLNMEKYCLGISSFSKELITLHTQLKESLIYGDQDILNYYFKDQWIPLDKRYNFQLDHMISINSFDISPVIFHFTGPHKPLDNIFSENACVSAVISLFRLYASISWQDICSLPLGTIKASWTNQKR